MARRHDRNEASRGWLSAAASLLRADIDMRGRPRSYVQAPWPEEKSRLSDLGRRGPISARRVVFYAVLAGFCVGFWLFISWLIGG
jgi:hypothetical protein